MLIEVLGGKEIGGGGGGGHKEIIKQMMHMPMRELKL